MQNYEWRWEWRCHWVCNKAASDAQRAKGVLGCVLGTCGQRQVTFPDDRVNGVTDEFI